MYALTQRQHVSMCSNNESIVKITEKTKILWNLSVFTDIIQGYHINTPTYPPSRPIYTTLVKLIHTINLQITDRTEAPAGFHRHLMCSVKCQDTMTFEDI